MDELKKKANPLYKELLNLEKLARESINEQVITNNLLGALCDATEDNGKRVDRTNEYKEQQKNGDIKFRKQSSLVSSVGVIISLLALSISIAANGIQPLLNMLKVL